MSRTLKIALILLCLISLSACAPGPNGMANIPNSGGHVAGFWDGLWNGFISPVTFVVSLFDNKIQLYEVHNNGGWYNFGFILGISCIFGGGAGASTRRRR